MCVELWLSWRVICGETFFFFFVKYILVLLPGEYNSDLQILNVTVFLLELL